MANEDGTEGILPDPNYSTKNDPRDAQVSSPMPGIVIANHAQKHTMQEAQLVGSAKGYPFVTRMWDEKSDFGPKDQHSDKP